MALMGAGYTPNLQTNTHFSDIRSTEVVGTGYTEGGVALTGVSLTLTAANSWAHAWAALTAVTYGQVVIPAAPNGYLYRCVSAGTTAAGAPAFPTVVGQTVTDGSAIWACIGQDILVFTSATASWSNATFTASYAVIYDAQSGTYASEPLLVLQTFATAQSPSAQTYQVIPDPQLGWFAFSPPS